MLHRDKEYEPFFQEIFLVGPDTKKCVPGEELSIVVDDFRTFTVRVAGVEEMHWQDITHGTAQSVMGSRAKRADLMKEVMRQHREAFGRKAPVFALVTFEVGVWQ